MKIQIQLAIGCLCWGLAVASALPADEPTGQPASGRKAPSATPGDDKTKAAESKEFQPLPRVQRIAEYLTGATFTGQFTIDGMPEQKPESYTITSCKPLDEADLYRFKVKIRYGDVDGEFPMDLKILWSGNTPVITLDSIWIPGLGTFSARVLIHQNRYAGTWQHDQKGGHLFGTIQTEAAKTSE